MQSRWVYHWSWWSILLVPWLVLSVDGCINCPWRWWWEIPVVHGLYVGRYPPQPVSVLWLTPTLSPTLLMPHATFKPKLFAYHFSFLVHSTHIYMPMKMEQAECSEMLAYKLKMPENYQKESIHHTEQSESLKSRITKGYSLIAYAIPGPTAISNYLSISYKNFQSHWIMAVTKSH